MTPGPPKATHRIALPRGGWAWGERGCISVCITETSGVYHTFLVCICNIYTQIFSEFCEVQVLTDSVERTLSLNSSAAGSPFRVRFCRQFRITCISRSVEFRGKL